MRSNKANVKSSNVSSSSEIAVEIFQENKSVLENKLIYLLLFNNSMIQPLDTQS